MLFRARAGTLLILLCFFAAASFSADDGPKDALRDRAWQVLRLGLAEKSTNRRADAVKALSLISQNRRAERLALTSLSDVNPNVRTAAAMTLGQLHATAAVHSLEKALSDKEPSVMLAAAYSLFLLKDKSAFGIYYAILMGDKKANEGMIQSQLDRLKDPKQMAQIGFDEGLGFVPYGGMGLEAYREIMKRNASPARASAARLLAHDPDPMSEDALIQSALADDSDLVRQAALDALAERGDPACIQRLTRNLTDNNKPAIRYRTAAVIIHLSERPKKPVLSSAHVGSD